jgi:hypothetical protein
MRSSLNRLLITIRFRRLTGYPWRVCWQRTKYE